MPYQHAMGRFRFEADHLYAMPAHFGGMRHVTTTTSYRDVTNLIVQYRTDRDALEPYVPEALEITDPTLTVAFVMNRGVEWMAGGSYNLVAVNVPVRFDGTDDHVEGPFSLVVWENKVTPILPGREMTGIPKIGAAIDEARHLGRLWMAEAAYEGNTFLELSLTEGDELQPDAIAGWNAMSRESHWIGWRYIPNVSGPGAALNHPTTFPQGMVVKQARTATATIAWKALTWQQAPTQAHITAALAAMPVLEVTAAFVTRGESTLLGDKARALR
jgi:acetoacetate decarboxylase